MASALELLTLAMLTAPGFSRVTEYDALASTTATTTTAETVAITSANSVLFANGRAYRVTFCARCGSTVSGDTVDLHVRRTNVTGLSLLESFRLIVSAAGVATVQQPSQNIVTNTTGADISTILVGTFLRGSGSGNVNVLASASSPAYIMTEDVGLASFFPGATAIS